MAPTAGFQFSTSDVLDRCEAVHYGFFYFDRQPNSNDDISNYYIKLNMYINLIFFNSFFIIFILSQC